MKRILSLALCLSLVCGLLCACKPREPEVRTLRLCEVAHSVFYAPFYAAMDLGYFMAETGVSNKSMRISHDDAHNSFTQCAAVANQRGAMRVA